MTAAVTADLPAIWHGVYPDGGLDTRYGWIRLTWRAERPHQVDADLFGADWLIAWDLLTASLDGPTGIGDVFITPHPDRVQHEIVISSPDGQGAIRIATLDLAAFVGDVRAVWTEPDLQAEIDADLAFLFDTDYRRPAPPPPAGGTA